MPGPGRGSRRGDEGATARRVGITDMAYGLDMTDEMLALARQNQAKAGVRNGKWMREFTGRIAGALTAAGPEVVGIVRARKPD